MQHPTDLDRILANGSIEEGLKEAYDLAGKGTRTGVLPRRDLDLRDSQSPPPGPAHDPASDSIEALLTERGKTHGDFTDHARVTQNLKSVMEMEHNWGELNDCQKEALHMITHKIGRILSGNPNHNDHWDDIAGYAKLVSQRIG